MLLRRLGIASASVALLTVTSSGQAALSGATDAHVGFEASGPAGLKITGTTNDLAATEDGGNVVLNEQSHSNILALSGWPGADTASFDSQEIPNGLSFSSTLANG